MNKINIWLRYSLPLILWWGMMFVGTTIPGSSIPHSQLLTADKLIHTAMYLGLTLFLYRFLRKVKGVRIIQAASITFVILAFYGVFDEWHQGFVGRTPSQLDYIADMIGVATASAFIIIRKLIIKAFIRD